MRGGPHRRTRPVRLLFYAMYDPAGLDRAPKVRIDRLSHALAGHCEVVLASGARWGRLRGMFRWLSPAAWHRIDAVYVESATSAAMPWDLFVLAIARLAGKPVGVYFRDAYQLFRDEYPFERRRQRLADVAWRITKPLLARLATIRFAPSAGLARVLGMPDAVLLPPGTDPELPDLGVGHDPVAAYVGALGRTDGFELLVTAMGLVRAEIPDARLLVVGQPTHGVDTASLPEWVEVHRGGRQGLADLLAPARVCVIPRLVTPYTNLAVPIKLMDYFGFGKPVVATQAEETARLIEASGGGLCCMDDPDSLAAALARILGDRDLAATLGARARAFAVSPAASWDGRARQLLAALVPGGDATSGGAEPADGTGA